MKAICKEVYDEVLVLSRGKIVNENLSSPLQTQNYEEAKQIYLSKVENYKAELYQPKTLMIKCWFIFAVFAAAILLEAFKDEPVWLRPIFIGFVTAILSGKYYQVFGSAPFQSIGISTLMNPHKARHMILEQKLYKIRLQADRAGPLGNMRFINYELEPAFNDINISVHENDSILRALFGLKNGAFDCVSLAGLVTLLLLERKIAARIEKFRNENLNTVYAHCYIVVNRLQGDIKNIYSWNDDCIIVDPWYQICLSVHEILEQFEFFARYPLLNPQDKTVIADIKCGEKPPSGYSPLLKKLSRLLNVEDKKCPVALGGTLCPRL